MNKSRTIINPSNGMHVKTWIVYQRPQSGGFIAVDHAGKSFYGGTEYDAVIKRAMRGRIFPLPLDKQLNSPYLYRSNYES